jgi:hypothetical protein
MYRVAPRAQMQTLTVLGREDPVISICPAGAFPGRGPPRALHIGSTRWLTHRMVAPLPEPDPQIDPTEPVPDDPAELLPDAPEPLPPAPIESTPDDPGGDPGGVPEPA